MAVDIVMPPLSQTMDTLALVEWLKKTGEVVKKGEPLFTVETDKSTLEVESLADGVLHAILVQPGEEVKVGTVIGMIAEASEVAPQQPVRSLSEHVGKQEKKLKETHEGNQKHNLPGDLLGKRSEGSTVVGRERVFISPRARSLMQQRGIPVSCLQGHGSGPDGAFIERDVVGLPPSIETQSAVTIIPAIAVLPADVHPVQLSLTRRTIARRMMESFASIPPVTYSREVDATALVELRKRLLQKLPDWEIRPTYTDFMILIVCRALLNHPSLNATFDGETILEYEHVNMALAVDTERGLMAPLILNAETKRLSDLAKMREDLIKRSRKGEIHSNELNGGSFTITNLGAMGIDHFTPIINPPQVAILGVGRIRDIPAVHEDQLCIRSVVNLILTCDHRVIDGAPAARFLESVAQLVKDPELLVV